MIRINELSLPLDHSADELRQAFIRFRASGKPMMAHSQGLYPSGAVTSTYMLGAAADQLWMQPDSAFQATGFAVEDMFIKFAAAGMPAGQIIFISGLFGVPVFAVLLRRMQSRGGWKSD